MTEHSKHLGECILEERTKNHMTQETLAAKIGSTDRTVQKIEVGDNNPKYETLWNLIHALNIDPRKLFDDKHQDECPERARLLMQVASCSEDEAVALYDICRTVLTALRKEKQKDVRKNK